MVEIVFNNTTVNVPSTWDDITLGEYEAVYNQKPESPRQRVELIATLCKLDAETLLDWPAAVFNLIVKHIMFIYANNPMPPTAITEIEGVKFVVPIEDELSLGAYIDAGEAQKDGETAISGTLAIVCRPAGEEYDYRKNEERQKLFAAQPMSKILGVMAFFLQCRKAYEIHMRIFGELTQAADLLPPTTKLLQSLGGGIKLSRIWLVIKYWYLTRLLRSLLRKSSPTYNTVKTRTRRKRRK